MGIRFLLSLPFFTNQGAGLGIEVMASSSFSPILDYTLQFSAIKDHINHNLFVIPFRRVSYDELYDDNQP